jgi:hypothetical protein
MKMQKMGLDGETTILEIYILQNVHHKIIQVIRNLLLEQLVMILNYHQLFV